jgi:hypothetical protein
VISLTPIEREIRRALIRRARQSHADPVKACITYLQLGRAFDPFGDYEHKYPMSVPPFRGLGEALGHVSMYEADHGRPLLSSLVVQQESRRPGGGFTDLARHLQMEVTDEEEFWVSQVELTVDFWSDDDPTRVTDAALERVVRDLVAIKKLVR